MHLFVEAFERVIHIIRRQVHRMYIHRRYTAIVNTMRHLTSNQMQAVEKKREEKKTQKVVF